MKNRRYCLHNVTYTTILHAYTKSVYKYILYSWKIVIDLQWFRLRTAVTCTRLSRNIILIISQICFRSFWQPGELICTKEKNVPQIRFPYASLTRKPLFRSLCNIVYSIRRRCVRFFLRAKEDVISAESDDFTKSPKNWEIRKQP